MLEQVRDSDRFDFTTRIEAHLALQRLGQESVFDERELYQVGRIIGELQPQDGQGRPADWRTIRHVAEWIPGRRAHPHMVGKQREIVAALVGALRPLRPDATTR